MKIKPFQHLFSKDNNTLKKVATSQFSIDYLLEYGNRAYLNTPYERFMLHRSGKYQKVDTTIKTKMKTFGGAYAELEVWESIPEEGETKTFLVGVPCDFYVAVDFETRKPIVEEGLVVLGVCVEHRGDGQLRALERMSKHRSDFDHNLSYEMKTHLVKKGLFSAVK